MTDLVTFARALGDPTRWRIVRLVMSEALCVCELADILEMPHSSVSSHVQVLRRANFLESEKCEKWTYFRIATAYVPIVRELETFFRPQGKSTWANDDKRTLKRLAERRRSCCPGPKKLVRAK